MVVSQTKCHLPHSFHLVCVQEFNNGEVDLMEVSTMCFKFADGSVTDDTGEQPLAVSLVVTLLILSRPCCICPCNAHVEKFAVNSQKHTTRQI